MKQLKLNVYLLMELVMMVMLVVFSIASTLLVAYVHDTVDVANAEVLTVDNKIYSDIDNYDDEKEIVADIEIISNDDLIFVINEENDNNEEGIIIENKVYDNIHNDNKEKNLIIVEKKINNNDDLVFVEEEPADKYFGYTEEDYEYLLKVIVGEAQCCSYEHQLYVGSVVLNRVHSDAFKGDTIKSIALAKNQYACFKDGNAYREPTEMNKQVALELLEKGSVLPENVVFQAQFKQGDGIYKQMGNTYFCYIDR